MVAKGERASELVERGKGTDFWQGRVPCWEMCHCSAMVRNECPAYKYPSLPCWEIEGTYLKLSPDGTRGDDISICQRCRVYKRWGQNKQIELKLAGKGIDSFRRLLQAKTQAVALQEPDSVAVDLRKQGAREQAPVDTFRRRHEVYSSKLDEIIEKNSGEGASLSKTLREIQDEYDWLPMDALQHVSEKLKIPSSKVLRTAIMGKGLSVIPREGHRVDAGVCIAELLVHYLDFLRHDLCGKCTPCREGMRQMYRMACDIARGQADEQSLKTMEEVAGWVAELAACNQGTVAANIVLTAIGDHRDHIKGHLNRGECPAGI